MPVVVVMSPILGRPLQRIGSFDPSLRTVQILRTVLSIYRYRALRKEVMGSPSVRTAPP